MKKVFASILILAVLLSLCACAAGDSTETTGIPETAGVQETTGAAVEETIGYSANFPEKLKPYTSPWAVDVAALAKKEGTLHYYFMSGKGMVMDADADQPIKWGDSTLIVFPDGKTMLIDSGVLAYAPLLVENLKRMGIEKLDYLMISHSHSDHTNGVLAENGVLVNFPIGLVLYCDYIVGSLGEDLINQCNQKGIPMEALRKGDVKQIGEVTMEVLWPTKDAVAPEELTTEDINNGSMVVRFDFKEHSSLFTGDLYVKGEADLIADAAEGKLDVDLLKIPHHGYNTSSSREFVTAVSPEVAVAMGSPASRPNIQKIYEENGADYCHDMNDQYVHVVTDGETMKYDTAWTRAKEQKK